MLRSFAAIQIVAKKLGFDQYFVQVTCTDTGSESGNVEVMVDSAATALIAGGLGTTYLGPFDYVDGTTVVDIVVGVEGACSVSAQLLELFCGYTVDTPGGDILENDLHQNGHFCVDQNNKMTPALIGQIPADTVNQLALVDYKNVSVLTNPDNDEVLDANNSGLFESLEDLTSYRVYSFSVPDNSIYNPGYNCYAIEQLYTIFL